MVTIPDSVTSIGTSAFYGCKNLMNITIPNGVTAINDSTFYNCTKLTSISIPDSVTSIGDSAFCLTGLKSVTIPGSVKSIGDDAFYWCNALTNVKIAGGVNSIGEEAFSWCYNLTSVTIPDGVTSVGAEAFCYCEKLIEITIPDSVKSIGVYAFGYYYGYSNYCKISNYTINCYTGSIAETYAKNNGFNYSLIDYRDLPSKVVLEPTCTVDGIMTYTCTCGKTYADAISATGHTIVIDNAVAASCTESGLTEGSHCSVCGEVITEQKTVKATGHTLVTDKAIAATCTTVGKTEGSHCSACGEVFTVQDTIEATGHTVVTDKAVAATCTTDGMTEGSHCSVCGEVITAQKTVKATGHTAVTDKAVSATCTTDGKTEGSHCSVCGETITEQTAVRATGHSYNSGKVTTTATCTTAGTKTYTCTVCGNTKTETIAKTAHTMVTDNAVAATCTKTGLTEGSHCSVCGEVITAQKTVAKTNNHNYDSGKITKSATCTTAGTKTYTCTVCGNTKTETIAKTAHTVVTDNAVAATCTKTGLTEGSHCSVCGEVITAQKIVAKTNIHNYDGGKITTAATCTTDGVETYTCTVCKETITETIPVTSHTIVTDNAVAATCKKTGLTEGSHWSVCGTVITAQKTVAKTAHKYSDWTVAKTATCKTAGKKTRTCSICKETESETISKKAHSYKKTVVKPTVKSKGYTLYKCKNCGTSYKDNYKAKLISIAKTSVGGVKATYTYKGKSLKPKVSVTYNGYRLSLNTDYTVSYGTNKNAGTGKIVIKGKGAYTGTVTKTFKIQKATPKISGKSSFTRVGTLKSFRLNQKSNGGKLYYKSSNSNVLTVNSSGVVTVKKAGKATVTVTSAATKNFKKYTKKISINIKKASAKITGKSSFTKYTTARSFKLGQKSNGGKLYYKSSNPNVVTVSSSGVVTIKGAGKANITVTSAATKTRNKATKTVKVNIKKYYKAKSISLSSSSLTLYYGGMSPYSGSLSNSASLTARVNPSAHTGKVTYKSSNPNIATVSSDGTVTAQGSGTATITATIDGKKATCKVKCHERPKFTTICSGKTEMSASVAVFRLDNYGSKAIKIIKSSKNVFADPKYTSFARRMILTDENANLISSYTINSGCYGYGCFILADSKGNPKSTWKDRTSIMYFEFSYDGVKYIGYAGYNVGSGYWKE
jgi:hypothetical protein